MCCVPLLNAQDFIPARERFDWDAFSSESVVSSDSLNTDLIQGNWMAFKGTTYDYYAISWSTSDRPFTLDIKGQTYRRTRGGGFYPLELRGNLILFTDRDNQTDSAYINLITDKDLWISFRKEEKYHQYQYVK